MNHMNKKLKTYRGTYREQLSWAPRFPNALSSPLIPLPAVPSISLQNVLIKKNKTLMLGKTEGRRRGRQRMRWSDGTSRHAFEQTPGDGERQGSLVCCSPWVAKSQT